jgi:anti-sigma regulatory factor (Ser/Thr protein kinase)
VGSGAVQLWVLPADRTAAFAARRHLEMACQGLSADTVDIARLLVTELVSNAVLHAGGTVQLSISRTRGGIRVDVYDESPKPPLIVEHEPLHEHGNGLRLVAALATSWGTDPRDDTLPGKRVWFEVA